jgi:hypothetical protein
MSKKVCFALFTATLLLMACTKSPGTKDLYIPTTADATSKATLTELQQGRVLYVNHCGECHNLYSPDNFSSSQWPSILNSMAPRTSLTASQLDLVKKYVTRGK